MQLMKAIDYKYCSKSTSDATFLPGVVNITHEKARKVEVENIGINPSISRWQTLSEGEQDSGTEHSISIRWKMHDHLGLGFYTR